MNAQHHRRLPILVALIGVLLTLVMALVISNQLQESTTAPDDSSAAVGYQGYARLGMGQLLVAKLTEAEYDQTKFGWWFTWGNTDNDINNELPDSIKFVAVLGNGQETAEACVSQPSGNGLRDRLSSLPDRTVVMIGNEIGNDDHNDPISYTIRYKAYYDCIKSVNPNLRAYVGGHVSPSNGLGWAMPNWINKTDPSGANRWHYQTKRINSLEFMTIVLQEYQSRYGTPLPADGFTTHGYAGVATSPSGSNYSWQDPQGDINELLAWRGWMKTHGYQNKPLIVKEYGILADYQPYQAGNLNVLRQVSRYYAQTKDQTLGNPNDDYRLVQQFAWYTIYVTTYPTPKWPGTVFFQCPGFDCTPANRTAITPLWQGWKDFVATDLAGYDSTPPQLPTATFSRSGTNVTVTFAAADPGGQINNYEVSVGSAAGKADIVPWTSSERQTSKTFPAAQVDNRYVNIIAIDDGYNDSAVKSILITTSTPSPSVAIPTATSNPTLVPTMNGKSVTCSAMDTDNNGTFNLIDFNAFSQIYQGNCISSPPVTSACGSQDANGDKKINIIDFYSFTSRYRKTSCSLATDQ